MLLFFKRLLVTLLAIVTTISPSLGNLIDSQRPVDRDFRVTSYIYAQRVLNPENLHKEDFDIITDLFIFDCATFDRDGNVQIRDDLLVPALKNIREAIGNRDVKISLTFLGPHYEGPTKDWDDLMVKQGKEYTHAFKSGILEDNIVKVLDKYDLDGVEFDYEYPFNIVNWKHFNDFLFSMDKKLGDKSLGIAISTWDMNLDTRAVNAVDHFELMLYDIYDEAGMHSTAEQAKELSEKVSLMGIPKNKVDFGLPFYSRPTDHDAYWYDYVSFADKLDENGFYHDDKLNKDFWFNTPKVIEDKTSYALEKGFRGVMIWHYTCDFASSDERSLLGGVGRAIENYKLNEDSPITTAQVETSQEQTSSTPAIETTTYPVHSDTETLTSNEALENTTNKNTVEESPNTGTKSGLSITAAALTSAAILIITKKKKISD